jgi:hypothetical protein
LDITDHADPPHPVKLTEYFSDFPVSFS